VHFRVFKRRSTLLNYAIGMHSHISKDHRPLMALANAEKPTAIAGPAFSIMELG